MQIALHTVMAESRPVPALHSVMAESSPPIPVPVLHSVMAESSPDRVLRKKICHVASSLGFKLKLQQEQSILQFVKGTDVFISLPTGFGKTLCYILLPPVFDLLRGVEKKSIVLVISPLIALMEDQVASIRSLGISAVYVSDRCVARTVKQQI